MKNQNEISTCSQNYGNSSLAGTGGVHSVGA